MNSDCIEMFKISYRAYLLFGLVISELTASIWKRWK